MIFLITLWLVVVNKFSSEAPEFMWGGWWGGIQTHFHVKNNYHWGWVVLLFSWSFDNILY